MNTDEKDLTTSIGTLDNTESEPIVVPKSIIKKQAASNLLADIDVFDKDQALNRIGDDIEFFQELIALFVDDVPNQVEKMYSLNEDKDYPTLSRAAHTIKGSAANMGANQLSAECYKLETASKNPEGLDLKVLIENIVKEFETFKEVSSRLMSQ